MNINPSTAVPQGDKSSHFISGRSVHAPSASYSTEVTFSNHTDQDHPLVDRLFGELERLLDAERDKLVALEEENQLILLQLIRAQERLDYYLLERNRVNNQLANASVQRQSLARMLAYSKRLQHHSVVLLGRVSAPYIHKKRISRWQRLWRSFICSRP